MRHHLALSALLPLLSSLALIQAAPTCSKSQNAASSAAAASGAVAIQEDANGVVALAASDTQSTAVNPATAVSPESAAASSVPAAETSSTLPSSSSKAGTTSVKAGSSGAAASSKTLSVSSPKASSAEDTTAKSSAASSAKTSAAASASASSSANSTSSSSKMGVSWPIQEVQAAPVAKFFTDSSMVSWWFDWNKNWNQGVMTADGTSISGQFVPMLFDTTFFDSSATLQDGFTELMGYNEPDLESDTGVSNYIDAAVAAGLKTQVASLRATYPDIKIHSPVMASSEDWLSTFFSTICPSGSASNAWEGCDAAPDYVSMHLYTTDADDFKTQVKDFHDNYGLPLVLSEFACYSFGSETGCSASEASSFMAETTEWLDQQDWVIKYAWFGAVRSSEYLYGVSEGNRLMDTSGALTDLGKQYINGGQTA
ncbi:hypothetical protein IAR50_005977 [Cryptococcus sp. DSM 104548]